MKKLSKPLRWLLALGLSVSNLQADVLLPNIFSDHMVLQRDMRNPVWGKADPNEKITVTIAGQSQETLTDANGLWKLKLEPMKAGGPHKLTVNGKNTITFDDVLVGEVWVCSGQSNMGFRVNGSDFHDLEIASANYPKIRLITIPREGTPEPQFNVDATWTPCTPETVGDFSAVGYYFGRRLFNTLQVPIGLINNAWGGSDLEAWLPRKVLEDAGQDEYLAEWDEFLAGFTDDLFAKRKKEYEDWVAAGKPGKEHKEPTDVRTAQKRPANIYNGVLHPTIGYGIKGVIWCQGESNVGRAYEYRSLFPLLINTWREQWGQGNFPFYWVQVADFNQEDESPSDSFWAELREAQTMTLALPNTGEAIVYDLGEARDIHYRNKQTVANRLVLHALAKDYGYKLACESPRFESMEIKGDKALLTFNHLSTPLYAFDVEQVKGFAIAGADKKFFWAEAKIIGKNRVEVWSDQVPEPVAVRYGWAHNPVVNLYDRDGLPVTPFRTDDWPGITVGRKTLYRN